MRGGMNRGTPPVDPLATALRAHYGRQSLDRTRLDRLRDLADAAQPPRSAKAPPRPMSRRAAFGVGVLALAAGALLAAGVKSATTPPGFGADVIAEEIALNHRKDLAVEFATPSFNHLGERMTKLDFPITRPTSTRAPGQLIGARYCSIRGSIAAQVKLTDREGRIYTLYETRWIPAYRGVPNRAVDVGEVRVVFWRQGDVLFGLARPRPSSAQ